MCQVGWLILQLSSIQTFNLLNSLYYIAVFAVATSAGFTPSTNLGCLPNAALNYYNCYQYDFKIIVIAVQVSDTCWLMLS